MVYSPLSISPFISSTNWLKIIYKVSSMRCTIIDIRGDYAFVKYDETGVVSEVAIALLPFGADIGDKLIFEDFEFTMA